MTPKQAFEKLQEIILITFDLDGYDEELDIINQALTELEELKRDVKRYFELDYKLEFDSEEEAIEWRSLYYKLLKVGKEHV